MRNRSLQVGLTAVAAMLLAAALPHSALSQEGPMRSTRLSEAEQHFGMSIWPEMYPGVPVAGLQDPAATLPDAHGEEYVHIACHIRALSDNAYGFRVGDWMPSMRVRFTLTNRQTGKTVEGDLLSLLDRAGPHYGINLRMIGAGDYTLVLFVKPPSGKLLARITGDYAGVPEWFEPFSVTSQFTYDPSQIFEE